MKTATAGGYNDRQDIATRDKRAAEDFGRRVVKREGDKKQRAQAALDRLRKKTAGAEEEVKLPETDEKKPPREETAPGRPRGSPRGERSRSRRRRSPSRRRSRSRSRRRKRRRSSSSSSSRS
ncbi:unnamed protein product [Cladocopium goreaui]|uniref:SnoaL-like domain-containing protein n=1 Tax=Cladocopium goreaui TaxID=2562237 RepID=A0A9P1GSJ8_9DINO|nr:unnamed protein product [Cladocopium goreaui]